RLKRFLLSEPEWQLLEALLPILKSLHKMMVQISSSQYPMLHAVIPEMDKLNGKLKGVFNDSTSPPIICKAVQRGLIVLDKYYSLTDDSIMWKTAMCALFFTPRRHWFMKAKWEDAWTDQAVREAHKVWTQYYKPLVKCPPPP
ncbi:hypothetical protein BDZ89DRAFT_922576, partial [Hymenopellis radicata]